MTRFVIENISEIDKIAEQFLQTVQGKTKFAFHGEMGAGKTTFIQSLCKILGTTNVATSPSFSIINEYHTSSNLTIFHFDFYRIQKIEEAYDIGFEEYFYSNHFCFIEWPEKVYSLLPDDVIHISINALSETKREIILNSDTGK